jgi:hypothetical protein
MIRAARRKTGMLLLLLIVIGVVSVSLSSPRSAAADLSYDGVASAYAFDATVSNPSIPLGMAVELAGPVAQAEQTSLDESNAFSAFPYLGQTATTLPGVLDTLTGVPLPPYPLIASSQLSDSAPKDIEYPGISLHAQSGTDRTSARADVGTGGIGMSAIATVTDDASSGLSSVATATCNLLTMSNIFEVKGVVTSAQVTLDPTGKLTRKSSLTIGEISVPGMALTIPPSTPGQETLPVPLPGVPQLPPLDLPTIPLPFGGQTLVEPWIGFKDGYFTLSLPGLPNLQFPLPAQTVINAFKATGIEVSYEAAQNTEDGVVAPALVLTKTLPAPPSNEVVNGETVETLTLGRAVASIAGGVVPTPGFSTSALGSGTGTAGTPSFSSASLPASAAESLGSVPAVSGAPIVQSAATGPQGVAEAPAEGIPSGARWIINSHWAYLFFLAAALAVLGSTSILRILGVRVLWHS